MPVEYAVLGGAVLLLAVVGAGYEAETLGLGLAMVAATLVASFLRRRPLRLLLVDVWAGAFVYLYTSDLVLTGEGVSKTFGAEVMSHAQSFILASFGASLIGAWLFDARAQRRTAARRCAPRKRPQETRLPWSLAGMLLATSLIVPFFVFFVVTPADLFSTARVQRSFADTTSRPIFIAALAMQPILAAYATRRYRERGLAIVVAWAVAPLAGLALYASGTRFYFGFMICGVLHYVLRPLLPIPARRCMAIVAVAVALMAFQGAMRASRTVGLVDLDPIEMLSTLGDPGTLLSSEGLLRVNAWVHEKRAWEDPHRPFENGFILYWWVPRAIWANKPIMEGRRLIEDVMDEGYFNPNHSVAGGFAMPALLDFGPWLGVLFSGIYGVGLAILSRFASRHLDRSDAASVVVSLLVFGVFFAARGLHTSLIFMSLCLLWCVPVLLLDGAFRRRRGAVANGRRIERPPTDRQLAPRVYA